MTLLLLAQDFQSSINKRVYSNSLDINECTIFINSIKDLIDKLDKRKKTLDIQKSINVLMLAQLDLELRLGTLMEEQFTGVLIERIPIKYSV